jgi:hypothetical protein
MSFSLFYLVGFNNYVLSSFAFVCVSLAEALDMQPPVMPDDGHTTRVTTGEDGSSAATSKDASTPEPVWDDDDTKAFYESLPDLRFKWI